MAQAPRTEAERKATPRPVPPKGVNFTAPRVKNTCYFFKNQFASA